MTKLIACLAWYDESPSMLGACIASLSKLPVDHLVAVDGGYQLFPGTRASSGIDQVNTITWTADAIGVGLTLHQPPTTWRGNEIEKRSAMFRLATAMATPDDWLLVIDADEAITHADRGLYAELELAAGANDHDVASCQMVARIDPLANEQADYIARLNPGTGGHSTFPARRFFRALPDLRVEHSHYTYIAGQGDSERVLWSAGMTPEEPALELGARVVIEHRNTLRTSVRNARAKHFYELRESTQIEHPYPGKEAE